MYSIWRVFANNVLIEDYAGKQVLTILQNKKKPNFKYFLIAFIVFIILAIIEIIVLY
ncbi:Mid2-like cell wall stress sensor domain protein [Staphylococcus warneri]|uniref:Mid2-like cell wall stress sensor domain protein n=1 Tax=Staphylococcus warneri TaxID=1292 RepID=UPI000D1F27AB|nr:Mid2-like cell wall stress sensor domain protein [Staphylococcus warneri]PTI21441.1 Mid2-like cell wall stress sensor domain protein [Staphylococcus warneri]